MTMATQPMLVLGSKDPAVALLISKLRAQGFWKSDAEPQAFTADVEHQVQDFQMTHLGPKGRPLDTDGVVGAETWWALFNPSGAPQVSGIDATIPAGLEPLRT